MSDSGLVREAVRERLRARGFVAHNCKCCLGLGGVTASFGAGSVLFTGEMVGRVYFGDPDLFAKIEDLVK